jgi:hypothetical protein
MKCIYECTYTFMYVYTIHTYVCQINILLLFILNHNIDMYTFVYTFVCSCVLGFKFAPPIFGQPKLLEIFILLKNSLAFGRLCPPNPLFYLTRQCFIKLQISAQFSHIFFSIEEYSKTLHSLKISLNFTFKLKNEAKRCKNNTSKYIKNSQKNAKNMKN